MKSHNDTRCFAICIIGYLEDKSHVSVTIVVFYLPLAFLK